MRIIGVMLKCAAAAFVAAAVCSPVYEAVAAPAPSIAGSWKGPFLGSNFTFEFTQNANGWAGRYQSEKFGKWVDLQNVSFANGTVRFSFQSQPPSTFTLTIDAAGKALNGSATFGPHPPLPMTLTRVS